MAFSVASEIDNAAARDLDEYPTQPAVIVLRMKSA